MIDVVAKALFNRMARAAPGPRKYWEHAPVEVKDYCRDLAVGALEALQEPSEEMLEAGHGAGPVGCCIVSHENAREIFEEMIAAALESRKDS